MGGDKLLQGESRVVVVVLSFFSFSFFLSAKRK